MKKIGLVLMFLFMLCIGLASCDNKTSNGTNLGNVDTFDVTFLNYDNSLLYKAEDVKNGQPAIYVGSVPTRVNNSEYSYTFKGWDKDISSVVEDMYVYATYYEVPLNDNDDSTVQLTGLSKEEKQRLFNGSVSSQDGSRVAYGVGRTVNAIKDEYIVTSSGSNSIFDEDEITNIKWTKSPVRQQTAEVMTATSMSDFYASLKASYSKKVSASLGIEGLFTAGLDKDFSISGSIQVNKDTKEIVSKLYQNINSFTVEIEGYKDYRNFKSYLSDKLLEDLSNLRNGSITPEQFINWYGTHVIMAGTYGGRMECNYHLMFNDSNVSADAMLAYKSQAEIALKDLQTTAAMAGGASSGFDLKAKIGITGTALKESFSFSARGGKYINCNPDMNGFMENYASWVSSFNDNEDQYSVMIDVRDGSLIPVWLLFPEEYSDVRALVETEFNNQAKTAENEWLSKTAYTFIEEEEFPGYKTISTVDDFNNMIRSNLNGNYVITNDIDFGGNTLIPFDRFNGKIIGKVVDGRKPTIKNFKLATKTYKHLGVFTEVGENALIENIDFANAYVDYDYDGYGLEGGFGVICGYSNGTIRNCNVFDCILDGYLYKYTGTKESVKLHGGAIAGWNNNGKIINCGSYNNKFTAKSNGGKTDGTVECNVAGITGMNVGSGLVQYCSSSGLSIDITLRGGKYWTWTTCKAQGRAGGIVGYNGVQAFLYDCTASNSYNFNIKFEKAESTGVHKYFDKGAIVGKGDGSISGNKTQ